MRRPQFVARMRVNRGFPSDLEKACKDLRKEQLLFWKKTVWWFKYEKTKDLYK
jgi:hypothetical protein